MEKFNRVPNGYSPEEVNSFLDQVINHIESITSELRTITAENRTLNEKLEFYIRNEESINKAFNNANINASQIKESANYEAKLILDEAKMNANRIINESLLKAEKQELEVETLRRDLKIYKRKLKSIIEQQLELVDEINEI